jgi:hypothetical protein
MGDRKLYVEKLMTLFTVCGTVKNVNMFFLHFQLDLDPRIQHFQVHSVLLIHSVLVPYQPQLSGLSDGSLLALKFYTADPAGKCRVYSAQPQNAQSNV